MRNGRSLFCSERWSWKPSLDKRSLSWILQDDNDLAIQRVKAERPKWQRSSLGKVVKRNWEGLSQEGLSQVGHTELERVARVELSRETNSDHAETCQLGLEGKQPKCLNQSDIFYVVR